jgi:protein-S-isoprenylcysteine O-methyltransferase Ste14
MLRRAAITSVFVLLALPGVIGTDKHLHTAVQQSAVRPWLIAVYFGLKAAIGVAFVVFVATRSPARRRVRESRALLACAAAILTAMALRGPGTHAITGLVLVGEAVAIAGAGWMLVSVAALGRCFSVLPEARGLVTRGPYRYIRHPLYLGEITITAGFLTASPRIWNVAVAAVFLGAQTVRMQLEERELTRVFPEYADYAARTPRLLPRVGLERVDLEPQTEGKV